MKQYHELCQRVLNEGTLRDDRTGTGTISIFGHQSVFDMNDGFPLLTTKKLHLKSIVHELLWFIRGDTNVQYLHENGVHIWDEWADENGDLGPIYGAQWRGWPGDEETWIDQLAEVERSIKEDPFSRRHIVSAWNVSDIPHMKLPPCHMLFQFYVRGEYLDLRLDQRSVDVFLGLPFNIASYSLLLHMMAQVTGHKPGRFIHQMGDVHIYKNHLPQIAEQLLRTPKDLPELVLNPRVVSIDGFTSDDINFINYEPHPVLKGKVSK